MEKEIEIIKIVKISKKKKERKIGRILKTNFRYKNKKSATAGVSFPTSKMEVALKRCIRSGF